MSVSTWGQSRQYNADAPRHQLALELPLAAPYLVHVDPTNLCNFRCPFCPTGHPELLREVGRPSGRMDFALFVKIMNDMLMFPEKPKVLHLYKDGEPLMHPDFGRMAMLAKTSKVSERINLTTNAALLTAKRTTEILDAGIDIVRVSVEHVHDAGYRERTITFAKYDTIIRNVAGLFEARERRNVKTRIWVKILRLGLTDANIEKFGRDFRGICDECLVMTPMGWSRTDVYDFTLGSNPTTGDNGETPLRQDRLVCPYPFYSLAINFDGSVSVCCADWSHGTVVGDVCTSALIDIWNGSPLQELRRMHLVNRRAENSACANCQTMQGLPDDSDLDVDRERLLPLFIDNSFR
ncbi:MAG: radical SAM/SPASM domain-containing protein [Desulfuromonadales bacterium]